MPQVGAGLASQVIMMRSEGDAVTADTQQAATLAALKAVGGGGRQKVVLQSPGESLDRWVGAAPADATTFMRTCGWAGAAITLASG
jgi:hypothetical protein